jgi:hypothetical protein
LPSEQNSQTPPSLPNHPALHLQSAGPVFCPTSLTALALHASQTTRPSTSDPKKSAIHQQSSTAVLAVLMVVEPCKHAWHAVSPAWSAYVPTAQGVHAVAPVSCMNVPLAQRLQVSLPVEPALEPASHSTHPD